jgi:hypothetical protein
MALGHGDETRAALARLEARLERGAVTVLGPLAPDAALSGGVVPWRDRPANSARRPAPWSSR